MSDVLIEGKAESWNVAAANAYNIFNKIMKCQELIEVCKFGSTSFGEKYDLSTTCLNKKESLERLILNIKFITMSSRSFIDKKSRVLQDELLKEIAFLEKTLVKQDGTSMLLKTMTDDRIKKTTHELTNHYYLSVDILIKQFEKLVTSLRGILGRISDEIDLETLKQQIIDGG